jgi:hypothetical protein
VIKRLPDMMTLRRDAAARLIAGIVASPNESGRLEIREVWIEHTGYHGNLLGGVIAGEDVHQLQESWNGLQANPRAQLWVSLYADAVRDARWDYKFFRCFNLLEAIADTVVQPNVVIPTKRATLGRCRGETGASQPGVRRARFTRRSSSWLARPPMINCGMKSGLGFKSETTLRMRAHGNLPIRANRPTTPPLPAEEVTAPSNPAPEQWLTGSGMR